MGGNGTEEKIIKLLSSNDYGLTIEEVAAALSINRMTAAKYLAVLGATNEISVRSVGRAKLHYPKRRNGDKWLMNGRKKSSCGMTGAVSAIAIILVVTATLLLAAMTSAESNGDGAFAISVTKDYSENVIILQINGPALTDFSLVMADPENKTITPRERVVFATDENGEYELRIIGYVPGRYVASIEANGKTYVQGFDVEPFLDSECNRSFLEYVYDVNDSSRELNGSVAGEYVWDVCRDFVEATATAEEIISRNAEERVYLENEGGLNIINDNVTEGNATKNGENLSRVFVEKTAKLRSEKQMYGKNDEPRFKFISKKVLLEPDKKIEEVLGSENIRASVYDEYGNEVHPGLKIEKTVDGEYDLALSRMKAFRPGRYRIRVSDIETDQAAVQETDFLWGLVSLNTRRSIYRPGETADFEIVVLDGEGHSACYANLTLTVTDPNGSNASYSTDEGSIAKGSECGLYTARYVTATEGEHSIGISASIEGADVDFSTGFMVLENYDFDIVRSAQSKIDPTQQDKFPVEIGIDSFAGAQRLEISEYVPAEFEISDTDALISTYGDTKILTWNKDLTENETSVQYSYSVPHIWPYLYELGPLKISYTNATFLEARPWYVAVDPAFYNWTSSNQEGGTQWFINSSATNPYCTGYLNPQYSVVLTGTGWYTPAAAYTDGGDFAQSAGTRVNATGYYGFNSTHLIPSDATIQGIMVQIARNETATAGTNTIALRLSNDGGSTYGGNENNTAEPVTGTGAKEYIIAGGPTEKWGMTWTYDTANRIRVNVTAVSSATNRYLNLFWVGINISYTNLSESIEQNKSWVQYTGIGGSNYDAVDKVKAIVTVSSYNPSASNATYSNNRRPDIEVGIWDGTQYVNGFFCSLNATMGEKPNTTATNCTVTTTDSSTMNAWKLASGRKAQIRGVYMDTNGSQSDEINVTGFYGAADGYSYLPLSVASVSASPQKIRNGTAINITANVTTENYVIDTVRTQLYYPNGTFWQNLSMSHNAEIYYNDSMAISFYPPGRYNVTVWVNDSGGRINATESTWFVPFAYLSDEQEIVINGSFSGWGGVDALLDNATDAGGPNVVDNELLLVGIGSAGNLSMFSYNSTSSQYMQAWNNYNASVTFSKNSPSFGDINHDGRDEIVMMRGSAANNEKLQVWAFNTTSQGWYQQWESSSSFCSVNTCAVGTVADTDNDTYKEVVVTDQIAGSIEIWGNDTANATGYSLQATIYTNGTSGCYYRKVACDLDADGIPEIMAQCRFERSVKIYEWNGTGYQLKDTVTIPGGKQTGPQWDDQICGDVDMDSKDEVVACGNMGMSEVLDYSGSVYSFPFESSGYTDCDPTAACYTQACGIGDYTNDGWPDWFDSSLNGTHVYSYNGSAYVHVWASPKTFTINPSIGSGMGGDADNDGRGEFLFANTTSPIQIDFFENDTSHASAFANTFIWPGSTSSGGLIDDLDDNGSAPGRDVNFEIANYSLANNASYLFARIGVNGSVTLTDGTKYYRMFVSIGTTGNQTTPEGDALPFKYDYRIQVNGSQCYVFSDDNYGTNVSSCQFGYSGGQLEIAVALSDLGLSAGSNANVTFETGSYTGKYDFAPDYPSFVSYGVPGGDTPPTASLGANPVADFNDTDGSVTFDLKCSDTTGVNTLKLYGNWSGSWSAKATNSTPTNDDFWNVTVNGIPDGVWKWGAWCNDTTNQEDWSDANRTFTVDSTNPQVGNKRVNESGPVNPGVIVCLNVSGVSDTFGIDTVWTTVTQSNGSILNVSMSDTGTCAGSAGDGWYATSVDVGNAAGTFYYNTTYANDTHGRTSSNASALQLSVTAPSCSVDFAMSANLLQGVQFDAQDPGTANASANGNGYYEVTDMSTSGCGTVNVSVMAAEDLMNGSVSIGIGNVTVNSSSSSSQVIQLSKSYQLIRSGVPAGQSGVTTLYFWLSTPSGQEPRVYNTTIYVKEEKE